jgi:hypothetical protein
MKFIHDTHIFYDNLMAAFRAIGVGFGGYEIGSEARKYQLPEVINQKSVTSTSEQIQEPRNNIRKALAQDILIFYKRNSFTIDNLAVDNRLSNTLFGPITQIEDLVNCGYLLFEKSSQMYSINPEKIEEIRNSNN